MLMKKSITIIILLSLIIGAITTVGLSRLRIWGGSVNTIAYVTGGSAATGNNDAHACYFNVPNKMACIEVSTGYPVNYLHSSSVSVNYPDITSWPQPMVAYAWISFKAIAADWLIWSAISAAGIGLLVWALEQTGTHVLATKKNTRR